MTDMAHMHPYLVGAPGLQLALDNGDIAETFQHLVMRHSVLAPAVLVSRP